MSLSIGIVGLPNVGKSTLFNALTRKGVPAENYPFCTIDPSVGVVAVPDIRLTRLAEMSGSKKTIPAIVEFVDIAGLVQGASQGEGLGNQFLQHIREVDAIAEVVRLFEDEDVHHVSGSIEPVRDIEVIDLELVLADMQSAQKRLERVERDARTGDKQAVLERETLKKVMQLFERGLPARAAQLESEERFAIRGMHFLTMKPIMYIFNRKSGAINIDAEGGDRWQSLVQYMEDHHAQYVFVDAGVENELADVHEDEKNMFRNELGVSDDGLDALIKGGYHLLDLISYFTTGPEESRAWTVHRGATAPEAAGVIHTDFQHKFIRADVIQWDKLISEGSWSKAREKGLVRSEGKEYIFQDGDVTEFRHG